MTTQEATTTGQAYHEGPAIWRINQRDGYAVRLCPAGHVVSSHKLDSSFGGSWLEAELAWQPRKIVRCYGAL